MYWLSFQVEPLQSSARVPMSSQRMLIYHQWVCSLTFDSEKFQWWVEPTEGVSTEPLREARWEGARHRFIPQHAAGGVTSETPSVSSNPAQLVLLQQTSVTLFSLPRAGLDVMETEQTTGSRPVPSQATVGIQLSSSTKGTSAQQLLDVKSCSHTTNWLSCIQIPDNPSESAECAAFLWTQLSLVLPILATELHGNLV